MGSFFFSDDTQIRTTEDQDYKRTVYLLDHIVTLISILFLQIKLINKYRISILHEDNFFSDVTRIRTSKGQDYKRAVDLLDHSVTAAVVSTSTIFLCASTIYTNYCILAKQRCTTQLAKLNFNHSIGRTHR